MVSNATLYKIPKASQKGGKTFLVLMPSHPWFAKRGQILGLGVARTCSAVAII